MLLYEQLLEEMTCSRRGNSWVNKRGRQEKVEQMDLLVHMLVKLQQPEKGIITKQKKRLIIFHPWINKEIGRSHVIMTHNRVARTIIVKDVMAGLEREAQMSRSTLMYHLYDEISD